ncbi:hypothetical protein M6B38_214265 [Iris pallida]|uniref:Uncharacterized protein n=1 Tax=Iris pallida TaxID=29817 RepID=A0AAX6E2T2_IRIPA|nr:hypothetical protein M6B38_214265 [Iris pallida]
MPATLIYLYYMTCVHICLTEWIISRNKTPVCHCRLSTVTVGFVSIGSMYVCTCYNSK